jgi:hypothetical protein
MESTKSRMFQQGVFVNDGGLPHLSGHRNTRIGRTRMNLRSILVDVPIQSLVKTTFSKTQDCFGNIKSWPSRFDPSRYTHCHVYACHMIKLLSSFYFDGLPFVVGPLDLSGVTVFRDLRHRAWYTKIRDRWTNSMMIQWYQWFLFILVSWAVTTTMLDVSGQNVTNRYPPCSICFDGSTPRNGYVCFFHCILLAVLHISSSIF